jgi:hypothetical protein
VKAFFLLSPVANAIRLYRVLPGALVLLFLPAHHAAAASFCSPTFVGSEACRPCHAEEYESFVTYAKKSRSFESIDRLRNGRTEEEFERCYSCHTTGYGRPGGFVSPSNPPSSKMPVVRSATDPALSMSQAGTRGRSKENSPWGTARRAMFRTGCGPFGSNL